jgi:hypothetical protein
MLWALASSVFVIYLYRKLNAEAIPPASTTPVTGTMQAELAALDEEVSALESRLARKSTGGLAS